jgi:hypothetical protein
MGISKHVTTTGRWKFPSVESAFKVPLKSGDAPSFNFPATTNSVPLNNKLNDFFVTVMLSTCKSYNSSYIEHVQKKCVCELLLERQCIGR